MSVTISKCTVCWFCVTMTTAASFSLYNDFTSHFTVATVHCELLTENKQTVENTSEYSDRDPNKELVGFVTLSIAVFQNLSTVCHYLTIFPLLVLCYYANCSLLHSVHCISAPHSVPFVGSVPLCPLLPSTFSPMSVNTLHWTVSCFCVTVSLLFSTVCPLSVSTPHCTVCWFCVTMSTALFYSLHNVCTSHCTVG
jgi:hypothetical protein